MLTNRRPGIRGVALVAGMAHPLEVASKVERIYGLAKGGDCWIAEANGAPHRPPSYAAPIALQIRPARLIELVAHGSTSLRLGLCDRRCLLTLLLTDSLCMSYTMTYMPQNMTRQRTSKRLSVGERKRQVTRDAVLDGVAEVFRDRGFDFTVQEVADRAGVTHRTVYRYFPNREALIDAIEKRFEARLAERDFSRGDDLVAVLDQLAVLFSWFDSEADLIHAVAVNTLASGERTRPSQRRTEHWRQALRGMYPNVPEEEFEPVFVIIRTMAGSVGWHLLTSQPGITSDQAASAVRQMVEAVLADLDQRNRDAAGAAVGRKP